MTTERWARVQALFDGACAEPASRRAAWVEAHADDSEMAALVRAMLDADATDAGEMEQAVTEAIRVATAPAEGPAGARIGPYRILSAIGQGGMGTVYLAERADGAFEQRVAIKVVRGLLDAERVRRFRAERQILASLQHPNIARLVDGGTTDDGWPYLVMEYVDGQPIDLYAEQHGLDVPKRLALFLTVCEAVGHAHRHLIVHRDLKPSNILVAADGTPKLLDFGIAKLLDSDDPDLSARTITGAHVLTPEYAAPEQVVGAPVTTATDVYALGVLLFELLTGRRPHTFTSVTAQEVERVVCHVDAPRPSTVRAGLSGDLDAIVGTALRKEAPRRYASVEALAEDIRRYLVGHPIQARPATLAYRARRFASRHRWGVAVAAIFLVTLIGFSIVVAVQAARVARERDVAQQERDAAREVATFLVNLFEVNDPRQARGNTVTARELLDRGAAQVEAELASQPAAQARLMEAIGRVYRQLGLYEPSGALLDKALARREADGSAASDELANTVHERAELARETGEYQLAETLHRRALAMRRALHGDTHESVASSLNNLGLVLDSQGRYPEAEALLREAIAMWRALLGDRHVQVSTGLNNLGQLLRRIGKYTDAEPVLREALDIRREVYKDRHPNLATSLTQYGQLQNQLGHYDEAERYMRDGLEMRLAVLGPEHPAVGMSYNNLASLLHDIGAYDRAEPLYRASLALNIKTSGEAHPETAVTMNNLASLLEDMGKPEEAEVLFRRALAIRRAALGDEHPAVARGMHNLGRALVALNRLEEAEALATRALAIRRKALGGRHVEVAGTIALQAQIRARTGQLPEALGLSEASLEMLRGLLAADHPSLATALIAHSRLLDDAGRHADAAAAAREALTIRQAKFPAGHPLIRQAEESLSGIRSEK